jgi:hypothetical protein
VTGTPTETPVGGSLPVTGPGTGVLAGVAILAILAGAGLRRLAKARSNA